MDGMLIELWKCELDEMRCGKDVYSNVKVNLSIIVIEFIFEIEIEIVMLI